MSWVAGSFAEMTKRQQMTKLSPTLWPVISVLPCLQLHTDCCRSPPTPLWLGNAVIMSSGAPFRRIKGRYENAAKHKPVHSCAQELA